MALAQTIIEQTVNNCDNIITLLKPLDSQINMRVNYIMKHGKLSKPQALEYAVTDNPMLWAKVYLDWESRDYQFPIIKEGKNSKKLVLRLGRRLGKLTASVY